MSEVEYRELVAAWLADNFVDIEHEVYLSDTGRFVDFVVRTPFERYAIEVEEDFESLTTGIGQTEMYAAELDATPVVVIPADVIEQPEFDLLVENAAPIIVTV